MKRSDTPASDGSHIDHVASLRARQQPAVASAYQNRSQTASSALTAARDSVLDILPWRRVIKTTETARRIPLAASDRLINERTGRPYISNSIRSSRYTIYDFLPKQLLFQCTRLNNFYFIVIGIPQAIPGFSTTGNFTTILPLLFFILLTIFKEGYDDWCRHRLDVNENKTSTEVLAQGNSREDTCSKWGASIGSLLRRTHNTVPDSEKEADGNWTSTQWQNVRVGNVVRVDRDGAFPADIVLLNTDHDAQMAFIETMALDGETNLKAKQAPQCLWKCYDHHSLQSCGATLIVEQPNKDLYSFDGHISLDGSVIPLTLQEVVLRGSILRNTKYAIGIVINTGEDCKIRMNANHHPKAKKPHLERWSGYIVLLLIAYVVLLSIGCSIGYLVWQGHTENSSWYLTDAAVPFKQIIIGYGIMFNNVIPLALYVSLEIVKLGQMMLISSDTEMYDEDSQQKMRCNTNTILENLGQVEYLLTDKTGTLTENQMIFRGFSVAGQRCYHNGVKQAESEPAQSAVVAGKNIQHAKSPVVTVTKFSGANSSAKATSKSYGGHLEIEDLAKPHARTVFAAQVKDFLLVMALCHTCLPALSDTGRIEYQASSPDESALVKAASELGFALKNRSSTSITISERTQSGTRDSVYDILDVVEFSSNRKRMSILLRYPDGRIHLLTKGADSVIIPRLAHTSLVEHERKLFKKDAEIQREKQRRSFQAVRAMSVNRPSVAMERLRQSLDVTRSARNSHDEGSRPPLERHSLPQRPSAHLQVESALDEAEIIHQCFQHLEDFAVDGLRTLMYARRRLSAEDYASWKKLFSEAQSSLSDRETLIETAAEAIEQSMDLVGVTAIEDKLQRDVPETIERLRRANIKIWMLTGDKRETAISIAHSSRICYSESQTFSLDASRGDVGEQIRRALDEISVPGTHNVAIVDGHTLSTIEGCATLTSSFYAMAIRVDSIICCRASPSQKASLVQGIRKHAPRKLTLTIGDGANDVAMIQAAHVGVGMMGREGMQAARVADYCIAQFSFLQRLLLVHGRWNYTRTAKFILHTFWKEMLFYLPQTLYQVHTGYSGSSLYENWSLTALNTLFTSLCVILPGMFEQDLRADTLLAVPELYVYGQKNRALNLSAFVLLMARAVIDGMIAWYVPLQLYGRSSLMSDNGAFALGHMLFSIPIIWTNWKLLLIDTHYKTRIIISGFMITVAGWWIWSAFLSGVYSNNISPFDVRGGFFHGFGNDPAWWATLVLTLTVLYLVDIVIRASRKYMIRHGWWPLWAQRDERRFQARELEAWQEIEHNYILHGKGDDGIEQHLHAQGHSRASFVDERLV